MILPIIYAEELIPCDHVLVNTSADINIIGKRNLYSKIKLDINSIITIVGITEGKIKMIGSIVINYCEHEIQSSKTTF